MKTLEEKGEYGSLPRYGQIAIGILIMQDIFAVIFMTVAVDYWPSPWAPAVIGLILARPLLMRLLNKGGHGELLVLLGLLLPLAGAGLFTAVKLKADLGALIMGMILAGHPKADELSKALLSFKDAFLVAFFLTIGLGDTPDLAAVGTALLLVLVMPFKVALFFGLLTRLRLRARTSMLASFSLANYSEFGLIVGYVGVSQGYMDSRWLMIIAIALSITFVLASPLNTAASTIYGRLQGWLLRWQSPERVPGDEIIDPGASRFVVIGMGRIGTGAYDMLHERFGDVVMGIDDNPGVVNNHIGKGRCVALGDASDFDFWERVKKGGPDEEQSVKLILLCLPDHPSSVWVARHLVRTLEEMERRLEIHRARVTQGEAPPVATVEIGRADPSALRVRRMRPGRVAERLGDAQLALRGDLVAAERLYARSLHLEPGHPMAQAGLARVLARQGRFAPALRLVDAAAASGSDNAAVWFAVGEVKRLAALRTKPFDALLLGEARTRSARSSNATPGRQPGSSRSERAMSTSEAT